MKPINKIIGEAYCESEEDRQEVWEQMMEIVERERRRLIEIGIYPEIELKITVVRGKRQSIIRVI